MDTILCGAVLSTAPHTRVPNRCSVTPAQAGVQEALKSLDSGFRRNDERRISDT